MGLQHELDDLSQRLDEAGGATQAQVTVNPLQPNSSKYYTLPYKPNLPFLISDIRALWRSALSARVPECQKLKMAG